MVPKPASDRGADDTAAGLSCELCAEKAILPCCKLISIARLIEGHDPAQRAA